MPRHRQRRMPGLRRTDVGRQRRLIKLVLQVPEAVGVVPALIVHAAGRLLRQVAVVAHHHQLDVLEAHVRSTPVVGVIPRREFAFRRAGRLEGVLGRKVRLADEAGGIACCGELPAESRRADLRVEVDPVIPRPVGERQQSGQDRRTRRLADVVGGDARGKARALLRHQIEVRRLDRTAFETEAVAALLVRSDEQDVGTYGEAQSVFIPASLTTVRQVWISLRMVARSCSGVPPAGDTPSF